MRSVFALVDCNNFYASCEKLFRPDLRDVPCVVLSNNDGCIVARSQEARLLGIQIGVPVLQVQRKIRKYGVVMFSSNYALYADLSSRVMRTLEELVPRVEVYSIDEAFLDLTGVEASVSPVEFGRQVRTMVGDWTGITVCVGIAPTKTLAKLANHAAKHYPTTGGVVDLNSVERQKRLLALLPVDKVWGIGLRLSRRLWAMGVRTGLDLARANPKGMRQQFSVTVERTVCELNGESCIDLEEVPPTKKQIICSRTFGANITTLQEMREAICDYATRAAEKLRREGQYAKVVTVFIRTSSFHARESRYANSATGELLVPSADTRDLAGQAMRLLGKIWREGFCYVKGGIMLTDFHAPDSYSSSLFEKTALRTDTKALMSVLDTINQSGKGRVFFAGQGVRQDWAMKRKRLSPAYTTRWSDIPRVK